MGWFLTRKNRPRGLFGDFALLVFFQDEVDFVLVFAGIIGRLRSGDFQVVGGDALGRQVIECLSVA